MKRSVWLVVSALAVVPLASFVPAAHATGAAACTISGTINFSPSSPTATRGTWTVEPAVIDCHGSFRGWDRILGPGSFRGRGSYTTAPHRSGPCLQQVGSGTIDYVIPTSEQDVHLIEPHSFIIAGAGSFTSPTLRGSFQVTSLDDGNCVTKPASTAFFLAQALMVRSRTLQSL